MSKETDQALWAMVIVVFSFSAVIAILGSWKKDIIHEIQEAQEELPEIVFEDPIILPPLYEPALPQLQGEV